MDWMTEQNGGGELGQRRPEPPPAREPTIQQAKVFPVFDRWSAHPGRRLTARHILAAYQAAEDGFPEDQCDMFDDRLEADGHLRSLFEARVEQVAAKPWIVQAGGDDPADKDAAMLLERALREVPNIIETFSHQLRSLGYGYAFSEIYWERISGLAVPVWFENVAQRRFRFDNADRPLLVTEQNWEGEELRPGKWWCSTRPGRIMASSGLFRTTTWWSHFKTVGARDWMVYANRFGIPYVYGQYDENLSDEEKEIVKKAVKSIGSDGWAVFSDAAKLNIVETTKGGGSSEVHGALVQLCNAENSKLIDGATLGTETQGPGSFALGKEHASRSFELRLADAERLAHTFETQVGRPFVVYNGLKARPPRLKFHLVRNVDPLERAKLLDVAVNDIGVDLDEDQVRQELQLKQPSGKSLQGTRRGQPKQNGEPDGDKAE